MSTLRACVFITKSCSVRMLSRHILISSTFFFNRPLSLPVIKPRPSSSRLSSSSVRSLTRRKLAAIIPSELVVKHSLVSPDSNLSAGIRFQNTATLQWLKQLCNHENVLGNMGNRANEY